MKENNVYHETNTNKWLLIVFPVLSSKIII